MGKPALTPNARRIRDRKAKAEENRVDKAQKRNAQYVSKSMSQGTLLTLNSYMFHVFCFTSIKVIIFNTDILTHGTFSLNHSPTHSPTHSLADSLTHSLTG